MPKYIIDYNKLIIYKIYCKDPNITDIYVGRTTDFIRRKYSHKTKSKVSTLHLYRVIRANGGWNNWIMEEIETFPCSTTIEANERELHWIYTLQATLNISIGYSDIDYKKAWYIQNKYRLEIIKKGYRYEEICKKEEYMKMFNIDYENEHNNPEWFLNNIKLRKVEN